MIELVNQLLLTKGGVFSVSIRTQGGAKWNNARLVAADATGIVIVSEGNETVALPWHAVAGVSFGDTSS